MNGYAVGHVDDIAQLVAVDRRMQRAFVDKNLVELQRILHADYLLVNSAGTTFTKSDVLAELSAPNSVWTINQSSHWRVRVHGEVGLVVADLHQQGIANGKPFNNTVTFSDTYVRTADGWQNIHAHSSNRKDLEN
jgi:hypothetical protein